MKQGWDGIEFLDVKPKNENKDTELETNKAFARTFETEEGKKVLEFLINKTLQQPTWIPGGDNSYGYAREGQNSIIREIQTRIGRTKQ
ncbi:hypothetical protein OAO89_03200 [Pelagibacteraceae bacterium]|jgi:hypothetical protein|nr:hypothetical protein [Pelagibacteraceae bacterium]